MVTPKKILIKDIELADEENARLRKENKELKAKLEEVAKELIQHHEEYKNMADMVVELQNDNKLLKAELFEIKRNTSYNFLKDELEITSNFEKRWAITLMRMKEAELREKYIEHLEQENKELKEKLSSFSL